MTYKIIYNRINGIAEDLLAERRKRLVRPYIQIHPILQSFLTNLSRQHPSITVHTNLCTRPITIHMTQSDFERLIGNIITNAIEAMNGSGTLAIATSTQENRCFIRIEDNGPGMTPDIREKVLKGNFTYGKDGGNGIGMAIVNSIVAQHLGSLDCQSEIGKGTCFTLTFPME